MAGSANVKVTARTAKLDRACARAKFVGGFPIPGRLRRWLMALVFHGATVECLADGRLVGTIRVKLRGDGPAVWIERA